MIINIIILVILAAIPVLLWLLHENDIENGGKF